MNNNLVHLLRERFPNLIESLPVGIFLHKDFKIHYANDLIKDLLEVDKDTPVEGFSIFDFLPPEDREKTAKGIEEGLKNRRTSGNPVIYKVITKKNHIKWLEIRSQLIDIDGEFYFLDFAIDRTYEIENERKLQEERKRFKELFDNAYDAIFFEKPDGTIINVNKAACKMLGYTKDELINMNVREIVPKEVKEMEEKMRRSLPYRKRYVVYGENIKKDGTRIPVEASIGIVDMMDEEEVIVIARDITERKKIEDRLMQIQKMETASLMSRQFVHSFNNILSGLFGYIDLCKKVSSLEKKDKYIAKIEEIGKRAKKLIDYISIFTKKSNYPKKSVDLINIIRDTIEMVSDVPPRGVSINFYYEAPRAFVIGNEDYLSQLFSNILLNAKEALKESDVKRIRISLKERGRFYVITVKDTGCGISKDLIGKIFEPFFTTKMKDTKTRGLGLTISYNIVKSMGGSITVNSEVGKGSTFIISLPKASYELQKEKKAMESKKKKILLVDDEVFLLDVEAELLQEAGYEVVTASNGKEAVEKIRDHPDIDVVLLDMIMPKLDGKGVLEEIAFMKNPPSVIIVTGYTVFDLESLKKKYSFVKGILLKPYTPQKLLNVLSLE